jgi:hypothetical protein
MGALAMSLPSLGYVPLGCLCSMHRHMRASRGMGATTSQEISTGVSTAGAFSGAIAAIAGATAVIPVIGPIVAGVTLLIGALGIGNGCGQTCTEATTIANNAETAFEQNLQAAQNTVTQNGCLTAAEQAQLIANYNTIYNNMVAGCQQIGGTGGTKCVSARQPGGQYDAVPSFLTPIQNMPVCAASVVSSTSVAGISTSLLIPLALIGAALFFSSDSR